MDHSKRLCGCGQLFQLPTLMSRESRCMDCARKAAVAVMEARKHEVAPLSAGVAADARLAGRDVTATGSRLPMLRKKAQAILGTPIAVKPGETYVVDVDRGTVGPEWHDFGPGAQVGCQIAIAPDGKRLMVHTTGHWSVGEPRTPNPGLRQPYGWTPIAADYIDASGQFGHSPEKREMAKSAAIAKWRELRASTNTGSLTIKYQVRT